MRVHVSMQSVNYVLKKSESTSELLSANLFTMEKHIEPMLSGWDDVHVRKYFSILEEMNQTISEVSAKLKNISEFCEKTQSWINLYNSDY